MKKLLCAFALVVLMSLLTACEMKNDGTKYYDATADADTPYEARVYMTLQANAEYLLAVEFLDFKNELEQYTAEKTSDDFENAELTVETAKAVDNKDDSITIPLSIKIDKVKQSVVTIKSNLFYRYRRTVLFNPLTVLKNVEGVQYYIASQEMEQRSSEVPNAVEIHENGTYQYVWYANSPLIQWDWENSDIIYYDKFANSPAWYVTAILISGIVGVIVYFACKKKPNKDIIS